MTAIEESSKKKSKLYLFIIILVLFLINLLLIYNLVTKNNKLTLTQEELVSTQTELADVQELKADLEAELDEYKGKNASMDSVITLREAELAKKIAEIETLLKKSNVTSAELARARRDIQRFKAEKEALLAEVDSLSTQVKYLQDENYVMQIQIEKGEAKIAEMEEQNTDLTSQVAVGKRIFLKKLEVSPMRDAIFGDMKETDKLKKIERIDVAFELANNDLADKGEKTLYFKLITPNKSTLVDPDNGSGTFNFQGGESMYTLKKVVNFQNKNEAGVVSIPKSESMTEGEYTLKVFSDTHEMSSTKFVLR
jgi:peptidoglycan hydrolase CwlO-like protein